jgi:hypothetical protein
LEMSIGFVIGGILVDFHLNP